MIPEEGIVDKQQVLEKVKKLTDMGDGGYNPGAMSVVVRLYSLYGEEALTLIDTSGIRGGDLWELYSRRCHNSLDETFKSLKEGTALQKLSEPGY